MSAAPELFLVHLWAPAERQAALEAMLEPHERERAERFAFPWLRTRYTVAHAALRTIAARRLGTEPTALRWSTSRFGKPCLPGTGLELNLSHAGDWGLVALGDRDPLGVDLEAIVPERASPEMIRAVTSPAERAAFAALPAREHAAAFFRLWVRKEAVIKALGTGLSRPLDTIDVPLAPAAPPEGVVLRPSRSDGAPAPGMRWRLFDVPAPTGHLAALVVAQPTHEPLRPPGPPRWLTLDDLGC
jgi:4'-phosphopantetheinyl transferase